MSRICRLTASVVILLASVQVSHADIPYPIIVVHGLVSDHTTWTDMTNFIQHRADLAPPIVFHVCLNHDESDETSWFERDDNGGRDVVPVCWTDMETREVLGNIQNYRNGRLFVINFNDDRIEEIEGLEHGDHDHSNQAAIYKQGFALKLMIRQVIALTGAQKVVLVGHSMGGLAIREYLQRAENGGHTWWIDPNDRENGHKVAKVITLATPHLGFDRFWWLEQERIRRDDGRFDIRQSLESLRDMRSWYEEEGGAGTPGIYLFGGNEAWIDDFVFDDVRYCNVNVNCNLLENGQEGNADLILGLNDLNVEEGIRNTFDNHSMPLPGGVEYVWVKFRVNDQRDDDLVVLFDRQWLHNGNNPTPAGDARFIEWHGVHYSIDGDMVETEDIFTILRGLDEPGDQSKCYPIPIDQPDDTWMHGFVTYSTDDARGQPDSDRYRFISGRDGFASISLDLESVRDLEQWGIAIFDQEDNVGSSLFRVGSGEWWLIDYLGGILNPHTTGYCHVFTD